MVLEDLYKRLSYGELSNLSTSNSGSGSIKKDRLEQVVQHINDGLLILHTKFLLKQKEIGLNLYEHITHYYLNTRYAQTNINSPETYKYLLDTAEDPFTNTALRILDVVPRNENFSLPLNDPTEPYSLFTPQPTTLQVTNPIENMIVGVIYQARPSNLFYDQYEHKIDLPDSLVPALTAYVGYRVYTSMNTETSSAKASEYFSIFNGICNEAEEKNVVNTSISPTETRFELRGWK